MLLLRYSCAALEIFCIRQDYHLLGRHIWFIGLGSVSNWRCWTNIVLPILCDRLQIHLDDDPIRVLFLEPKQFVYFECCRLFSLCDKTA